MPFIFLLFHCTEHVLHSTICSVLLGNVGKPATNEGNSPGTANYRKTMSDVPVKNSCLGYVGGSNGRQVFLIPLPIWYLCPVVLVACDDFQAEVYMYVEVSGEFYWFKVLVKSTIVFAKKKKKKKKRVLIILFGFLTVCLLDIICLRDLSLCMEYYTLLRLVTG